MSRSERLFLYAIYSIAGLAVFTLVRDMSYTLLDTMGAPRDMLKQTPITLGVAAVVSGLMWLHDCETAGLRKKYEEEARRKRINEEITEQFRKETEEDRRNASK